MNGEDAAAAARARGTDQTRRTPAHALALVLALAAAPALGQVAIDLATTPADLTVWGTGRGYAGRAVEIGDHNGDGFADLVTVEEASAVVAIYFGPFVFPEVFDLLTDPPPTTIALTVDRLRSADLDGDRIEDLIVGHGDVSGGFSFVAVYRGRAAWPATLTRDDADWRFRRQIYDSFGPAAVGDLNGDGSADLALAAVRADGPADGRENAGEVYVFLGPASAWRADWDLTIDAPHVRLLGADGAADNLGSIGDGFGHGLEVADVLGDGQDDLIIGAPGSEGPPGDELGATGEVYVFAGRAAWPATLDTRTTPPELLVYGEGRANPRLGYSHAVGDWDADGERDLVLGAIGGVTGSRGAAYVLRGRAALSGTRRLSTQPADTTVRGPTTSSQLGHSVRLAEVDGNGFLDLVLGAPGMASPAHPAYGGAVFVLAGRPGFRPLHDLAVAPADLTVYGADVSDGLGETVVAKDADGDRRADLFAGAQFSRSRDNARGSSAGDAGEAHLVVGRRLGPSCSVAASAGPAMELCGAGSSATLDGGASVVVGCLGATAYRWLDGATVIRDWSPDPTALVTPAATALYTLEVRCSGGGGPACLGTASVLVAVDPDLVPDDLGNTLRGLRRGGEVTMSWASDPRARSYNLYRGTRKGVWPAALLTGLAGATASLPDVAPPPALYLYRSTGASCSGREGR